MPMSLVRPHAAASLIRMRRAHRNTIILHRGPVKPHAGTAATASAGTTAAYTARNGGRKATCTKDQTTGTSDEGRRRHRQSPHSLADDHVAVAPSFTLADARELFASAHHDHGGPGGTAPGAFSGAAATTPQAPQAAAAACTTEDSFIMASDAPPTVSHCATATSAGPGAHAVTRGTGGHGGEVEQPSVRVTYNRARTPVAPMLVLSLVPESALMALVHTGWEQTARLARDRRASETGKLPESESAREGAAAASGSVRAPGAAAAGSGPP